KQCQLAKIMPCFGFGHVELGTVTKLAQPGNAKPRIFRIPESEALINSMGFPNPGADKVKKQKALITGGPALVGINIGKSKATRIEDAVSDYLYTFEVLYELADYFAVNVSSPNTPQLRDMQKNLTPLLSAIQSKNQELSVARKIPVRPVLVKIAPELDLNLLDSILEVCMTLRVSGLIATNTTVNRVGVNLPKPIEGGLSGRPLFNQSTEVLRHLRRQTRGQMTLIGVGGVLSPEDAYKKIRAGASLVQVYTGLVYRGPEFVKNLNDGLAELLKRDGLSRVQDAVGLDA
ncbi:MAG TPA: quinone-dependent dihydroorotate dehydrogenase, partial [Chroococcales cyanobacterium]